MTLTSSFRKVLNLLVKIIGWISLFSVALPLSAAVLSGRVGHYYGISDDLLTRYANFMVDRPLFIIGFITIIIWMITVYVKESQTA